ncbi:MAG: CHASE domain-containing protein [Betaproteobacteria bacterium]|nr:CHASE domain-containing protein [Betaproteobacteria bacterium]
MLRATWLLPSAVALVSLALFGGLAVRMRDREAEDREMAQAREIALITAELRGRLSSHAQFLRGLGAFFSVDPDRAPEEWRAYTRRLDPGARIPGIEAYGFASRVRGSDAGAFVASIRRSHGLPDFSIKPTPALEQSFVVVHVAPASELTSAVVGLDLFSEPKRRLAVEQSRDRDDIALTGRIALRHDNSAQPQPALLMVMPVFRPGSAPATLEERRRDSVGAVYSAYRLSDFMASLNFVGNASVGLRVFDDESFNSEKEDKGLTLLFDSFAAANGNADAIQEAEIHFGERKWVLQFQPKGNGGQPGEAALVFVGGLLTSFLLGLLTWNLSSRRRQAEAYAREMNADLQTLVDHIPGGVSLIDSNLRFSAVNRHLLEVLDLPEELFATGAPTLYEVLLYNAKRGEYGPGDPETLARNGVGQARRRVAHTFERTRPNGRTLEVRGAPLPDGGIVTIYTDITERKRGEAELLRHRDHLAELVAEQTADLRRAKDDAERSNLAKSEFLTNMSHELRTPLHAILSFAELGESRACASVAREVVGDQPPPEKARHYFTRIRESGSRLLLLINDLLDLAKLEAGKTHVQPKLLDVSTFVREVGVELEPLLARRGLHLAIQEPSFSTEAMCDPAPFAQVMRNLIGNAIKFSPENGKIAVSFGHGTVPGGRRTDDTASPALSIAVTDEGIGIPEDELSAIFDKFVQSSKTRTGAGGTGLGLSISREIVRAHHGTIVACNNPGGGARFTIQLPIAPRTLQRDDL